MIAPLRTGSGTRIKILEAWSAARVRWSQLHLAAEGLEYMADRDLLIADDGEKFGIAGAHCRVKCRSGKARTSDGRQRPSPV